MYNTQSSTTSSNIVTGNGNGNNYSSMQPISSVASSDITNMESNYSLSMINQRNEGERIKSLTATVNRD